MAKVRLAKFKGASKHTFHLHIKETEWRYNQRGSNKVRLLLRYLRENSLCEARPMTFFLHLRHFLAVATVGILSLITTFEAALAQEKEGGPIQVEVDEEALQEAFEAGNYEKLYRLVIGYAEAGEKSSIDLACVLNWFGVGTEASVTEAHKWCSDPHSSGRFAKAVLAVVEVVRQRSDALDGRPIDYVVEIEELANAGDGEAMIQMAQAHREGVIEFDYEEFEPQRDSQAARYWIEKAAEAGHPEALHTVARDWTTSRDPDLQQKFLSYMEHAAEQDYAPAAGSLGTFYRLHADGTSMERATEMRMTALKWFRRAAELDPDFAMSAVWMLQDRDMQLLDQDEAINWMRVGAEGGDVDAMKPLADVYLKGTGVRRSMDEAKSWYQAYFTEIETWDWMPAGAVEASLGLLAIAAEINDPTLLVDTFPRLLAATEGRYFERLVEARDRRAAHFALGIAFRDGIGLDQSIDAALENFSLAADDDHIFAARERDFILASRMRLSADILRNVQAKLAPQGRASYGGYLTGPIDGIWGRSTFNAIRAWQCAVGEPVTGQVDASLPQRLEEQMGAVRFGPEAWTARLFDAIDKADADCVRASIANGANVSAISQSLDVLEHLDISRGYWDYSDHVAENEKYELARTLVASGAPLRAWSMFSFIANGDHRIVEMFLEGGVNPLARIEGKTLIEWAAYYDQPHVAEVLVKYGALPLSERRKAQERLVAINTTGYHPGGIHKAREALEAGAWIDGTGSDGETALVQALRGTNFQPGALNYIRFLLNAGADPNKEANSGFRDLDGIPLHLLIFFNADTLDGDKEHAERFPYRVQLAREALDLLIARGAKVGARDSVGRTPLHRAAEAGSLYAAQVLVSEGALIDVHDETGRRPIDYAEDADVIAFLLNPSSARDVPKDSALSYGSGFIISSAGHVITNSHVIEGCTEISLSWPDGEGIAANLLASDPVNDFAVLALSANPSGRNFDPIPIRLNDANLGESVLVAGFPFGDMVSSELKVTSGIVNALKGPGNDVSRFQVDAAIQPGNSGRPILDRGGNVIGVVVSQLDKRIVEERLGSIPENVNFGIKASTLETFLSSNNVEYIGGTLESLRSVESVARTASGAALMLTCF